MALGGVYSLFLGQGLLVSCTCRSAEVQNVLFLEPGDLFFCLLGEKASDKGEAIKEP